MSPPTPLPASRTIFPAIQVEVWLDEHMCGALTFVEGQKEYMVNCEGKTGSIVTVHHPSQYLQICELQVFGEFLLCNL